MDEVRKKYTASPLPRPELACSPSLQKKKGIFFLTLTLQKYIPKIKCANTAVPFRNNFQDPVEFSSIGSEAGGEGVGIQWKGGFHMRDMGILVRKLELLNPLRNGSEALFWSPAEKIIHHFLLISINAFLSTTPSNTFMG